MVRKDLRPYPIHLHIRLRQVLKDLTFSMPMMTNADGTPKLPGVGAGTKEYVYNQPRAHGVNWRYIRYANVLLMYAEAVLSGGKQGTMTPLQAVNKVRNRANFANLQNVTMDDVKHERVLLCFGRTSFL